MDSHLDCVSHLSKHILAVAYQFHEKKNDAAQQFISN